jgi:hypothetical protein
MKMWWIIRNIALFMHIYYIDAQCVNSFILTTKSISTDNAILSSQPFESLHECLQLCLSNDKCTHVQYDVPKDRNGTVIQSLV